MLKLIEWWAPNGPITKNAVFLVTTLFFGKFCFGLRASNIECWFNIPTTQISTLILFLSAKNTHRKKASSNKTPGFI